MTKNIQLKLSIALLGTVLVSNAQATLEQQINAQRGFERRVAQRVLSQDTAYRAAITPEDETNKAIGVIQKNIYDARSAVENPFRAEGKILYTQIKEARNLLSQNKRQKRKDIEDIFKKEHKAVRETAAFKEVFKIEQDLRNVLKTLTKKLATTSKSSGSHWRVCQEISTNQSRLRAENGAINKTEAFFEACESNRMIRYEQMEKELALMTASIEDLQGQASEVENNRKAALEIFEVSIGEQKSQIQALVERVSESYGDIANLRRSFYVENGPIDQAINQAFLTLSAEGDAE